MLDRAVNDALIGAAIDDAGGMAVAVLHRGRVYRHARGFVDRQRRRPTTMATPFRLASITKTMTAVIALQMVEEGTLSLDDTVGRLLPGMPERWSEITVRQLLTHTSGIPHYPPGPGGLLDVHLTGEETLRWIAKRPLVAAPGERFTYSSYGYAVLGAILERVEGRSFEAMLDARILEPLGMTSTFVEDSRSRRADWPAGWRIDERGAAVPSTRIDLSSRRAGGGVRGTVDDLLVFADSILRNDLVTGATFDQMTTATELPDGTLVDYGLGVAVYPRRGHRFVAHAGGQPETTSLLVLVPQDDLIVVAATNVEGQDQALSRIADAAVDVLVTHGDVHRDVVGLEPADDAVAFVLRRAMSWGLAELDRGRLSAESDAVDDAFSRFSAMLAERRLLDEPEIVVREARELHHPRAHRVIPLVGLAVAQAVRDVDGPSFEETTRHGSARLFARFIEICDADAARCPPKRRLPTSLASRVVRLDHANGRVSSAAIRAFRCINVLDEGGVDRALALLQPMIGADAHPDLADDVRRAVEQLVPHHLPDALRVAQLNVALHPRTPRVLLSLAEVLMLSNGIHAVDDALLVLDPLGADEGAASISPRLWREREGWLRRQRSPHARIAADVIRAFALARVHPATAAHHE
jgi:CubicO group peptidase (beta-lactamase class C family)